MSDMIFPSGTTPRKKHHMLDQAISSEDVENAKRTIKQSNKWIRLNLKKLDTSRRRSLPNKRDRAMKNYNDFIVSNRFTKMTQKEIDAIGRELVKGPQELTKEEHEAKCYEFKKAYPGGQEMSYALAGMKQYLLELDHQILAAETNKRIAEENRDKAQAILAEASKRSNS